MITSQHPYTWRLAFCRILLPLGLWILGTCGLGSPMSMNRTLECWNPSYNPQCHAAQDEISCQMAGGIWETCLGRMCRPGCLCATPRGGCPCSSGHECAGYMCLAQDDTLFPDSPFPPPAGLCQLNAPLFGCFSILSQPGEPAVTLCID